MRRSPRRTCTGVIAAPALLALILLGVGCGEDTTSTSDLQRVATSLEDAARKAGAEAARKADGAADALDKGLARAQAEAFRLQVRNRSKDDRTMYAGISVLRGAADDLPGNAQVTGIADADGDGKDDDGKVEITVDGSKACVTVSSTGIDVSSDSC